MIVADVDYKYVYVNPETELPTSYTLCRDSSILFPLEINRTNALTASSDRERPLVTSSKPK